MTASTSASFDVVEDSIFGAAVGYRTVVELTRLTRSR